MSNSSLFVLFLGINGLLTLKDIANQKGWKITANEHFDPVSDFSNLDVSPQLEAIRRTRTRIIVLNTMARYTVVILSKASQIGMLKEWVWIVTDGSTNTVTAYSRWNNEYMNFIVWSTGKSSQLNRQLMQLRNDGKSESVNWANVWWTLGADYLNFEGFMGDYRKIFPADWFRGEKSMQRNSWEKQYPALKKKYYSWRIMLKKNLTASCGGKNF